jgi:alkylation response protein AidB-like acyl-CoA dehydrogenase
MIPGLTDEQRLLGDNATRFLQQEWSEPVRRKTVEGDLPASGLWPRMADMGWLGIGLPAECGGIGGALENMILMEAFGRSLFVSGYLSSTVIAGQLLSRLSAGNDRQARIEALVAGEHRYAFAAAEAGGRRDLHDVDTVAVTQPSGGYRLNGRKTVVLDASDADTLIVVARTSGSARDEHGISLFLVPATTSGIGIRPYRTYDGRAAADVVLRDVDIPAGALLGERDAAWPAIECVVDHASAALCAEAVGAMDAACAITVEYLKTRKQFGRAIGSFQALQHRIVDVYVATEESRSIVLAANMHLASEPRVRRRTVAAAKIFVGRAGKMVAEECVQMHGGIGIADEYVIGHYFKRLLATDALFGDADYHAGRFPLENNVSIA